MGVTKNRILAISICMGFTVTYKRDAEESPVPNSRGNTSFSVVHLLLAGVISSSLKKETPRISQSIYPPLNNSFTFTSPKCWQLLNWACEDSVPEVTLQSRTTRLLLPMPPSHSFHSDFGSYYWQRLEALCSFFQIHQYSIITFDPTAKNCMNADTWGKS